MSSSLLNISKKVSRANTFISKVQHSQSRSRMNNRISSIEADTKDLESIVNRKLNKDSGIINTTNKGLSSSSKLFYLKSMLARSVQDTTVHGIPRIFLSNNLVLKVMWSIFCLVSISGCSVLIAQSCNEFYNYDVITKTRIVNQDTIKFPAVTVCNNLEEQYSLENILFRCFFKGNVIIHY